MTVYGGHFPWAGVGHVGKEKDGFRHSGSHQMGYKMMGSCMRRCCQSQPGFCNQSYIR